MIHLENKSNFFFLLLENAVNSVFIRCAGLTPWQISSMVCRRKVSMWNCLQLLPVLLGSFGTVQQHHMDFSLAHRAPPLKGPCNKSTMTRCNLDQKLPALAAIRWQCGCQFHVTSNPCCVPTCTPSLFPVCLSFMFMTLIITKPVSFSLTGILDCTIYLSLLLFWL